MSLVAGGEVEKERRRGVSMMSGPFLRASFKNETHNWVFSVLDFFCILPYTTIKEKVSREEIRIQVSLCLSDYTKW